MITTFTGRVLFGCNKLFDDIVIVTFTGRVFVLAAYKLFDDIMIVTFTGRVFVWLHINCLMR